jgi:hypothetical protein
MNLKHIKQAQAEAAQATAGDAKAKFCDKEYDLDTGVNYFAFGNGKTLEFDSNRCSDEIRKQLMLHGAAQKIGDSFAGAKGNFELGIGSAQDVIEQLYGGVWKAGRGEGESRPRLAELAEAISRIKSVVLDRATAAVEKASDEQRKAWRLNAKVRAVIAQIRAEKAAKALEEAGEQELEVAGI